MVTLTSEPSVPDISVAERRFWYGDNSSASFKLIERILSTYSTFIGVQLKGEFFQFEIFRLQFETFQLLNEPIYYQTPPPSPPPLSHLKIIRKNQRAVPEKVQDKSEKNSIAVYENSSFRVAEERFWLLGKPLCENAVLILKRINNQQSTVPVWQSKLLD